MWISMSTRGIILLTTVICIIDACTFPINWRGTWVKNGFGQNLKTTISPDNISGKGRCLRSRNEEKFLLVDTKVDPETNRQKVCYSCLVFTVRHTNVIQYKEKVACDISNTDDNMLDRLCGQINGESTLETLVREHAVPIQCPAVFQHTLDLSYAKDYGYCEDETDSQMTQCASGSRMNLRLGSCDSPNYSVEEAELECLATWKFNGGDWLYVKYGHNDYRCMFYDKTSSALGLSADASCIGISVLYNAPTSITWQQPDSDRDEPPAQCNYPSWFTQREWTDLEANHIYRHDLTSDMLVVDRLVRNVVSYTDTSQRHVCQSLVSETFDEVKYVTKVTDGCKHGYQCVIFRQKSDSVMEFVTGEISTRLDNACSSRRLLPSRSKSFLLIDNNADPVACPKTGKYTLQSSPNHCPITLEMGKDGMVIKQCDMIKEEMLCLAQWKENNNNHLVISKKSYPRSGNCFTYTVTSDRDVIIDIDQKCNYDAPFILDSSYPHPPFRLPPPTDSGDEGEKADLTKSGYQKTSDTAEHNLALTLSGNRGSAMHHMLTLITFTVFLSYL